MMEEKLPIYPGESFVTEGSNVITEEGPMSGQVTLRIVSTGGSYWPCEIISITKPEWEWMLNKVVKLSAAFVKEQTFL